MESVNIVISGVGGQGTLLASRVLGSYAEYSGYDCKLSEVHGMAQRGGSVVTYVKMGEKIFSPVIEPGDADVLLAFEKIEAGRYSHYIKKNGVIISSTQEIMPMPVIGGSEMYPKDILDELSEKGLKVLKIDADGLALSSGSIKSANIVLIGCLTKAAKLNKEVMLQAVKDCVPQKSLAINLKAFEYGYNAV